MELISKNKAFGGWLQRYRHRSKALNCEMVFAVYLPPQVEEGPVPFLYWLSGLTCTDENFCQKAGAFRTAAELGLAIVCPDTSPRGTELPGEHDSYDFGSGAGFYINATEQPWAEHYRMYDYVSSELPALVEAELPFNGKRAISGHSMGGHGALICALKNPERYCSVSAFAPISNPTECSWGQKAFRGYLGEDRTKWKQWDASLLMRQAKQSLPLLVDQGGDDEFLSEQLRPEALQHACTANEQPLTLRMHPGYDHSYYFISSFIDDHLQFHARYLTEER
ncbi:S-formylglutathione hydrolase [Marinobacterium sp. CAU 1594]|nr:S-formylglutathione hydrolase [Marinobacterium arenosum]